MASHDLQSQRAREALARAAEGETMLPGDLEILLGHGNMSHQWDATRTCGDNVQGTGKMVIDPNAALGSEPDSNGNANEGDMARSKGLCMERLQQARESCGLRDGFCCLFGREQRVAIESKAKEREESRSAGRTLRIDTRRESRDCARPDDSGTSPEVCTETEGSSPTSPGQTVRPFDRLVIRGNYEREVAIGALDRESQKHVISLARAGREREVLEWLHAAGHRCAGRSEREILAVRNIPKTREHSPIQSGAKKQQREHDEPLHHRHKSGASLGFLGKLNEYKRGSERHPTSDEPHHYCCGTPDGREEGDEAMDLQKERTVGVHQGHRLVRSESGPGDSGKPNGRVLQRDPTSLAGIARRMDQMQTDIQAATFVDDTKPKVRPPTPHPEAAPNQGERWREFKRRTDEPRVPSALAKTLETARWYELLKPGETQEMDQDTQGDMG